MPHFGTPPPMKMAELAAMRAFTTVIARVVGCFPGFTNLRFPQTVRTEWLPTHSFSVEIPEGGIMTCKSHFGFQRLGLPLIAFVLMWPVNLISLPTAQDLKEFHRRIQEYVHLQRRIQVNLPNINKQAVPAQIAAHRNTMAGALRSARRQAQQGDIFFEGISQYIVTLIHSEIKGIQGASARQMIKDGNPKVKRTPEVFPIQVNAVYPDGAPLSTVPPNLLRNLPALPPGLDYRFVGRDLILRDIDANIIVDYITGAVPLG